MAGVKLVVSGGHEGLKAAVTKVLQAIWPRCGVHFARKALAQWRTVAVIAGDDFFAGGTAA